MEIKEAIERLRFTYDPLTYGIPMDENGEEAKIRDAIAMAISALEKQDGKKPFYNGVNYECPYCNATIINGVKPWYCDICGQRIDWSDDYEKR